MIRFLRLTRTGTQRSGLCDEVGAGYCPQNRRERRLRLSDNVGQALCLPL